MENYAQCLKYNLDSLLSHIDTIIIQHYVGAHLRIAGDFTTKNVKARISYYMLYYLFKQKMISEEKYAILLSTFASCDYEMFAVLITGLFNETKNYFIKTFTLDIILRILYTSYVSFAQEPGNEQIADDKPICLQFIEKRLWFPHDINVPISSVMAMRNMIRSAFASNES